MSISHGGMQLFTSWLAAQAQGTRVKTIQRSKARSKSPGRDEVELTPIGGQRFSVGVPTIPIFEMEDLCIEQFNKYAREDDRKNDRQEHAEADRGGIDKICCCQRR